MLGSKLSPGPSGWGGFRPAVEISGGTTFVVRAISSLSTALTACLWFGTCLEGVWAVCVVQIIPLEGRYRTAGWDIRTWKSLLSANIDATGTKTFEVHCDGFPILYRLSNIRATEVRLCGCSVSRISSSPRSAKHAQGRANLLKSPADRISTCTAE